MSELLPCPFCGEKPSLTFPCEADHMWTISCSYCCMELASVSKEEAVERWNTRHYPQEVQQAVERMKPILIKPEKLNEYHPDGSVYLIRCVNCKQEFKLIGFLFSSEIRHCRKCGQAHLLDWDEDGRVDTALQKP